MLSFKVKFERFRREVLIGFETLKFLIVKFIPFASLGKSQ